MRKGCNTRAMSDFEPTADVNDEASPATPDADADLVTTDTEPDRSGPASLLATTGLALAVLVGLELLLTVALGLAVDVGQLSRVSRIGYAFLTQLEKSPLSLLLVIAAVATALAAKWAVPDSPADRRTGLTAGLIIGFAVVLGIGTVLALVAGSTWPISSRPRRSTASRGRVLAIFVVRNLGAAAVALVVASTAVRTRPRA